MTFLEKEKDRQIRVKRKLFSPVAQMPGVYRGAKRDFALHETQAHENLFRDFRDRANQYFSDREIPWHAATTIDGRDEKLPTNHLCSSQVACVNTLWPCAEDAGLSSRVFRLYYPDLLEVLPMDADTVGRDSMTPFLSFEWIGAENYLGEVGDRFRPKGMRQRGALATSADFAFRFKRHDAQIHLVLGEWKYTESYSSHAPDENPTRRAVYQDAYRRWRDEDPSIPDYEHFFVEPFYQLFRMTLLAREMERAKNTGRGEMNADIVSVLLIAPLANTDYLNRITSEGLKSFGRTVPEVWGRIAPPDRFAFVPSEGLMHALDLAADTGQRKWVEYLLNRYGWWTFAAQ